MQLPSPPGRGGSAASARLFHIAEAAWRQQLPLPDQPQRRRQQSGGKWRIQEDQVEAARRQRARRKASASPLLDRAPAQGRSAAAVSRSSAAAAAVRFHQRRRGRAARQRLDAQRAAAGEQVQHPHAGDVRRQPVEQRLAHAVRRGPQARRIRKGQLPAAQAAADDAHFLNAAFHARKPITMRGPTPELKRAWPAAAKPPDSLAACARRLARSATRLTGDFTSLFRGRKIDAELLDELEARLIGADVGVEATQAILENLRASVARRELADADALMAALRAQLLAILAPCAVPLAIDRSAAPFVIMVVGVNGSGKTTSIGKLAMRLARRRSQGDAGRRRHLPRGRRRAAGYLGRTQRRGDRAAGRRARIPARWCSMRCARRRRAASMW